MSAGILPGRHFCSLKIRQRLVNFSAIYCTPEKSWWKSLRSESLGKNYTLA
jgi:hypothetical protein